MKEFRFLSEIDDEELYELEDAWDGASWMFGRIENLDQYEYDIVSDYYLGIHSFLNHFPPGYVATVLSITGPTLIEHNADNEGLGWGFDITTAYINVRWVRFRYS